MTRCEYCAMPLEDGRQYHPYAACLMFLRCGDAKQTEENLAPVVRHGAREERERLCALAEELANASAADLTEHECASGFGSPYTMIAEKELASEALREFVRRAREGA